MSFNRQYSEFNNIQVIQQYQLLAEQKNNNTNKNDLYQMEFQAPNFKEEEENCDFQNQNKYYNNNMEDYQQPQIEYNNMQPQQQFIYQQQQQQNEFYQPYTSDYYSQDDTQILHDTQNNCPQIQHGIYYEQENDNDNNNNYQQHQQSQQQLFDFPNENDNDFPNNFSFPPAGQEIIINYDQQYQLQKQEEEEQQPVKIEAHNQYLQEFQQQQQNQDDNLSTESQNINNNNSKSLNLIQDKKEEIFQNLLIEIRQNSHRKIHQYHKSLKEKGIKVQSEKQLGRDIKFIKEQLQKKPELNCTELLLIYHRKPNRMKIPLPHNHREQVEALLKEHDCFEKSKQLKKNDFIKFLNNNYKQLPKKIPKDSKYPQLYFKGLYKQNPRTIVTKKVLNSNSNKEEHFDSDSMTADDNIGQYLN